MKTIILVFSFLQDRRADDSEKRTWTESDLYVRYRKSQTEKNPMRVLLKQQKKIDFAIFFCTVPTKKQHTVICLHILSHFVN